MTTTAVAPACPECRGSMFDNRETKRNPKAPDFKCKDRQCSGVIWPPRGTNGNARSVPAPTQQKQAYSSGPALPYETESETGAPPQTKADGFSRLFNAYDVCFDHAIRVADKMAKADIGSSPEAVAAIAATLLIQADRQGLTR